MKTLRRRLVLALLFLVVGLTWGPARAWAAGRIELAPVGQAHGPLELTPRPGSLSGDFTVRNLADEPLIVSRVAVRSDAEDVRVPARVLVHLAGGGASATVPPHGALDVHVTWSPERGGQVRSFYGEVVVTSSDERAGEVAMGIHGRLPGPLGRLGDHLLSLMLLFPAGGALLLAIAMLGGLAGGRGRVARGVGLAVGLAEALLAGAAYATFHPDLLRASGTDGLQLVEHGAWLRPLGAEYFVGIDGGSLLGVVLLAVLAPCAVLASWRERRQPVAYIALLLVALAALLGATVAQDALLWLVCTAASVLALVLLVGGWGSGDARTAAGRLLVFGGLAVLCLTAGVAVLHAYSDRTFLVDGTTVSHTWSLPDLMRVDFARKPGTVLGAPVVKAAFVLTFLGCWVLSGGFPAHAWLPRTLSSAPPAVGALVAAGLLRAGAFGMLRLDVDVLPDALRWAAPALLGLGAASAAYAALAALGQKSLMRVLAFALVAQAGVGLMALSSATPEGLAGFYALAFAGGAAAAAGVLALGLLEARVGTLGTDAVAGLARDAALLALFLAAALLAVAQVPGTTAFWGPLLAATGATPRAPALALVAGGAWIVTACAVVLPLLRVLRGNVPAKLRHSALLEPFGGLVPELSSREAAALLPLLLLAVGLGLYPAPMFDATAGAVRDHVELIDPVGPDQIALLSPSELPPRR